MIWVLIVIAVLLAVLVWEVGAQASHIGRLIRAASDLNLEQQAGINHSLEKIELHIKKVISR